MAVLFGIGGLIQHHAETADAEIGRHLADALRGLHAALARLDHHHHQVHTHGRAPPQVLDARFHVEDHHLAVAQHQMRYQAFQQHALRTRAASGGMLHRAQHQQVDSLVVNRVFLRQCRRLRD